MCGADCWGEVWGEVNIFKLFFGFIWINLYVDVKIMTCKDAIFTHINRKIR
ncbi:hypothetical protein CE91St63_04070 [[Clostridium] hylemonae]|nr:hypothetical protein CE91St63_04070 [[Clostridium] hylemonae]